MKMYILIKDTVPLGIAVVAAAHASLAAYLKFKDSPEVEQWLSYPNGHPSRHEIYTQNGYYP
jgi:hypothetical protein